jgi:polyisoprenyl-phosphate glycosyltransferase
MKEHEPRQVTVIVPCCNEEDAIEPFLDRLRAVSEKLHAYEFTYLFVDDGSKDRTNDILVRSASSDPRIKLITLSRNFGHQRAITAGVDMANGDYFIIIDADLQDPPELIPRLLEQLAAGYDVVHAVRTVRRVDSPLKRLSARAFYFFMRHWVMPELPSGGADFKAFNRRVLVALRRHRQRVRFLRGTIANLGFRQTCIPYTREARHGGASKYPLRRVLAFARDAVIPYSLIPFRLLLLLGLGTGLLSAVFTVKMLFGRSETSLPILSPAVAALLLGWFSAITFLALGVLGEYLGCILREVRQEPLYIIAATHNLDDKGKEW